MLDFNKIEKKWQKIWKQQKIYKAKDKVSGKKNFYHLVMFPYPSGDLHIGHWYNFSPADVFARFKKMNGFNVLSPIGFDAFGLPAENAAIKKGIHPKDWTDKNIKAMTAQLESMGNMYDWSRMIITADTEYYKWTQWMFLQFYKNGLAYKKKAPANWCPKCHTVLANEQVIDGKCERCDTQVIQRDIEQWLFKITDYAERLLKDLDKLDWPEKTKLMQRNWIGRSDGSLIKFAISRINADQDADKRGYISDNLRENQRQSAFVEVFTTRLDTIFGCTYLVMAPEHPLIQNDELGIKNYEEVKKYIEQAKKKTELQRLETDKQKTGMEIKGVKAINPFNSEEVPIFVADYVLGHYGTGAVMAVPAHDQRDWEFAKKYNLLIKIVICPNYPAPVCPILEQAYTEDGYLVDSGEFIGLKSGEARKKMAYWLEKNRLGSRKINYKFRDWLISRQRYWGAPIPIIYCSKCWEIRNSKSEIRNKSQIQKFKNLKKGIDYTVLDGREHIIHSVPERDLPIKLPNVKNYLPTEEGKSPLAHSKKFVNVKCPKCGNLAKRETDTMDTFVCSSWYYLAYAFWHKLGNQKSKIKNQKSNKENIFIKYKNLIKAWLPVDMYIGGAEHATMHLLYVRFFTKALQDFGYLDFDEPFAALRHQGTILGSDGQKMSKSRGNVVDPDNLVKKFGSDTVRMYLCFMGPYEQGGPWNPGGILGITRFFDRVRVISKKKMEKKLKNKRAWLINKTIKEVSERIERLSFNTAISALMVCANAYYSTTEVIYLENWEKFLKLLAPFAPHFAEELWRKLGNKTSIHLESWPQYDKNLIKEETFELVIQVNGRARDTILVNRGISQKEAEKKALSSDRIKTLIAGKKIKKVIFVADRLINFVV